MQYLLFSILALVVGPLVLTRLDERPVLSAVLDVFVLVSIVGLVAFQFLAPALQHMHVGILVCLGLGVLVPFLIERLTKVAGVMVSRWGFLVGFTGLAIHAAVDGTALATVADNGDDVAFAWVLVLHRLPVGIAVWWLAKTTFGMTAAIAALSTLIGLTIVGYMFGVEVVHEHGTPDLVGLYQALVAGALVHVAIQPRFNSAPPSTG